MGAALISDILFTFYSRDKKLSTGEIQTLGILSRVVWFSLVFIVISGIALFFSDPEKYSVSVKFLGKMSMMGVLLLNGFFLDRFVWPQLGKKQFLTAHKNTALRRASFVCGAISVFSWIAVCILGVLDSVSISYTTLMIVYASIIGVAILGALGVEYLEFERN